MGLGINESGNNWKYVLCNFIVVLVAQVIFSVNDLMNEPGVWPGAWFIVKAVLTSATATLIFYGYNKQEQKKDGGTA